MSRTEKYVFSRVSILVLMDFILRHLAGGVNAFGHTSFNPCFNGFHSPTVTVLPFIALKLVMCFNPCFNGFHSPTISAPSKQVAPNLRFNPCFNGFHSPTRPHRYNCVIKHQVSILVLMDFILRQALEIRCGRLPSVSILVLMDFILRPQT